MIERFRGDADRLWPAGEKLGVAVSGGPDSMALLLLANAARPGMVEAATVDHRLREESAAEAAMVSELCKILGVPHRTLPVDVAAGNLQAEARNARYGALDRWLAEQDLPTLATAHHADDQVETFLMRLNRGSGVAGLSGIRPSGNVPGGSHRLIRPLLAWRKRELIELLENAGADFARDPSNRDQAFDRVKLRENLTDAGWLDIGAIARSVTHLAEADATIEWMAAHEWAGRVKRIGRKYVYRPAAPRTVRLRVVSRIIEELGGDLPGSGPRGSGIARLLDRLEAGEQANLAGVLASTVGDAWRFEPEPPRNTASQP
nr:tRNA lysidine(34) synthetase TilS [Pontixanthobacter luteolus]